MGLSTSLRGSQHPLGGICAHIQGQNHQCQEMLVPPAQQRKLRGADCLHGHHAEHGMSVPSVPMLWLPKRGQQLQDALQNYAWAASWLLMG